jgi:diacylglycerol O-acyltransferase
MNLVSPPRRRAQSPDERYAARLSPLDASFLDVEGPSAHMHVGWAAEFLPPSDRPSPTYTELRSHIESRLGRAPRYRQRLAELPLGLEDPVWIDDDGFDADEHIRRAPWQDMGVAADAVFSRPLARDRSPWELWIGEQLTEGRLGVVGKVHHCMVDGLAAWDLAGLLLDPTPDSVPQEPDRWRARPAPSALEMLASGLHDRAVHGLKLVTRLLRTSRSPTRLVGASAAGLRRSRALARAALPPASPTSLNQPLTSERRLIRIRRAISDLQKIKERYRVSLNDVLLAVCAGAMRDLMRARGEEPTALKTMVPASVRLSDRTGELGNQVSAVFVDLPCDEPSPVHRLRRLHRLMGERKQAGDHHVVGEAIDALSYVPRPLRQAGVKIAAASPLTFNLTVSNIPGPDMALYMRGCRLEAAYPVVPIPERHGLSIGMTTIEGHACFGVYVDPGVVPDAEDLDEGLHRSIDELLAS